MRAQRVGFIAGIAAVLSLFSGCSLERPASGTGLRIVLEDKQAQSFSLLNDPAAILADPTSNSDFNCFTVNVTGSGIVSNAKTFGGCTSTDNFAGRGPGILAQPVTRGSTIELELPAGQGRTIDVYGIYPSLPECGGTSNQSSAGYFLGGVTKDLLASATVSIGINFNSSSLNSKITCSGGSAPATQYRTFVFSSGNNEVRSFLLDSTTGVLTHVTTATLTTAAKLFAHASGKWLYVANGTTTLNAYSVNSSTGAITAATGATWGASTSNLVGAGDLIYGYDTTNLYPMSVNSTTGALTAQSSVNPSHTVSWVGMNSGGNAYTSGSPSVFHRHLYNSSTGAFTSSTNVGGTQYEHFAFDPQNRYFVGRNGSGTLDAYLIGGGGTLTAGTAGSNPGTGAGPMAIDPTGTRLYVLLLSSNTIKGYTVDPSTATLTALAGTFTTGGSGVSDITLDPSGKYALVVSTTSGDINVLPINTDGTLGAATAYTAGSATSNIRSSRVAY